jgi:DNA-binding PadR family transcriptional regulator
MYHEDHGGRAFGRRFAKFARRARGGDEGHGHHHHGHSHGGGGRHALGRFFAHGDLRLVILHLIAEKPRHGYDIIKAIEDSVAGAYSPSPGVIYPTLTLLEELGYVVATADGAKKLHAITDEGRSFLDANRAALDMLLARMSEAGGQGPGRSMAIRRAMENLKTALKLRMAQGGLSEEQVDAIAAAIDATARGVEKI